MKKVAFFCVFLLLCLSHNSKAQISIKDSSVYTPLVKVAYGYYFPAGNLVERFGDNSSIQLHVDFKTKKYWMFGINGSFLFGKDIKDTPFDSIANPEGYIINQNGELADVRMFERGFTVSATVGRMFSFNKPNPNSGVTFDVGLGFIQHKIRIETIGNNVPQLSKEYKKGYDRLTNGFLLSENLGYTYLSDNRMVNFYIGIECMQGFTMNRRVYDFDKMKKDNTKRLDLLYGIKAAWILPLYKKTPQEYYLY